LSIYYLLCTLKLFKTQASNQLIDLQIVKCTYFQYSDGISPVYAAVSGFRERAEVVFPLMAKVLKDAGSIQLPA